MRRRSFLKLAGLGVAGAAGGPVAQALSRAARAEPAPGALQGKRWAMVVDEKKCLGREGCQACIQACHRAHNVPAMPDPRHEVKWVWKEPFRNVFPERVTPYLPAAASERPTMVLCNHCDNPPCVRVCPTQATWKRADGLVMMDMHRCIGCRYCVVACPYGSRSFNFEDPRPHLAGEPTDYPTRTKGVVEKCTFCAERLAAGQRPLCVEACEGIGCGALVFGDAGDPGSAVSSILRQNDVARRKPELGTSPHVFYLL
ncbi:MAG TPA: 4Fe-4S dicluster domain-containing protein [Anaeromyxobacteraceae bacterium]|nr:4Fe-4S dicluster domain-containing protein [Anaeromyxobacteraceae bacterium]